MTTIDRFTKAFAQWEKAYRKEPFKFLSEKEIEALKVAPLSRRRAIAFNAYLRNVK